MAKVFYSVSAAQLEHQFSLTPPCSCYSDPYSVATYQVKTSTGTTFRTSSSGAIVKALSITCNNCGSHRLCEDLEYKEKYEDELGWQ